MPAPLYTQTVIAMVWDFDRTLSPGNMQEPLFAEYDIDPETFWAEVEALPDYHARFGEIVARDTAYLLHLLTYVNTGRMPDLTNAKLRELGARLDLCPGIPEFFKDSRERMNQIPLFAKEGISVEHYVVSTGILPMIEGSALSSHIDGVWANTFTAHQAKPGYLEQLAVEDDGGPIRHLGVVIGNTSKTRAVFEINKGVNKNPDVDVNARVDLTQRRVPLRHMIYIADGPSDVPVFSILNQHGGKTLGVYTTEPVNNHKRVKQLQEQGRIQGMAEADYRPGKSAYLWLMDSLDQIAEEIVDNRRRAFAEIPNPPGH
jgi:hypothetical protein